MLQVSDEKIPLLPDENGVLHVTGTRVTLDCVVGMFDSGASPEDIADEYDSLTLDQVYGVLFYYLRHRDQVRAHLAEQAKESEVASREAAEHFPNELREKFLREKGAREPGGA